MTTGKRPWGFMAGDTFVKVDRGPMEASGLGPPPFDVRLPSGETRHIIEGPAADEPSDEAASSAWGGKPELPTANDPGAFVPQAVIITGAAGCGKTRHAGRIARFYNRANIVDDWKAGDPTPAGSVCLTRDIVPGAVPFGDIAHLLPSRSQGETS